MSNGVSALMEYQGNITLGVNWVHQMEPLCHLEPWSLDSFSKALLSAYANAILHEIT